MANLTWQCGCDKPYPGNTDVAYNFLCDRCEKNRLVGQTIDFLRFGDIPANGVSFNYRDNVVEEGLSVYEIHNNSVKFVGYYYGFTSRIAYRGKGEVVGIGSDGEPLVKVLSVKKITRNTLKKLMA